MLLEQEVSVLCRDSRGRTPLHYAAARGHAAWLSELLQLALAEEDCCLRDGRGYTPLHWACYNGESRSGRRQGAARLPRCRCLPAAARFG